jgi:hypothetical protein
VGRAVSVLEIEHRASRVIRSSPFNVCGGLLCRRIQMHDRDTGDDGKEATVTAQNPIVNLVGIPATMHRRDEIEPPAAVGTAQDLKRL